MYKILSPVSRQEWTQFFFSPAASFYVSRRCRGPRSVSPWRDWYPVQGDQRGGEGTTGGGGLVGRQRQRLCGVSECSSQQSAAPVQTHVCVRRLHAVLAALPRVQGLYCRVVHPDKGSSCNMNPRQEMIVARRVFRRATPNFNVHSLSSTPKSSFIRSPCSTYWSLFW